MHSMRRATNVTYFPVKSIEHSPLQKKTHTVLELQSNRPYCLLHSHPMALAVFMFVLFYPIVFSIIHISGTKYTKT